MPRYKYQCKNCNDVIVIYHGMEEKHTDCEKCDKFDVMEKLLSTPINIKQTKNSGIGQKVGQITKHFIEENRKILEEQKKEAKEKSHEQT